MPNLEAKRAGFGLDLVDSSRYIALASDRRGWRGRVPKTQKSPAEPKPDGALTLS
jgi:hypothetical protein